MTKKKRALITGITGQDGSYMADLLLEKGYEVHGLVRRSSNGSTGRIDHLDRYDSQKRERLILHYGDLTDTASLIHAVEAAKPDEVYNFASQSHVRISFEVPESTADITGMGALRLLEAVRRVKPTARVYQASSSEMFGKVFETPQTEKTPFHPRSPYGIAKVFAHWTAVNYREAFGMFVVSGILFNHESPRRAENFVTRKITSGVAEILAGKRKVLKLGNLSARRDWGYAPEYVEAAWRMLQQKNPSDYVIATGEMHTVREFVEEAFRLAGIKDWKRHVKIDPALYRPAEVDILRGDSRKAKRELGWEPKVRFKELVRIMLEADCEEMGVVLHGN